LVALFRKRDSDDSLEAGEAIVTSAEVSGGHAGEAGTSAVIWHLHCRLHLSASESVEFEARVGGTFSSAGDLTFNVGDAVPVRYDPDKPAKAKVDVAAIRTRRDEANAGRDAARLARAEHEQIERLRAAPAARVQDARPEAGFRLVAEDVVVAAGNVSVLGMVEGDAIRLGDQVTINGERTAIVDGIEIFRAPVQEAEAGQHVALTFDSLDATSIFKGDLLSRM
jgi:hypothetical protein